MRREGSIAIALSVSGFSFGQGEVGGVGGVHWHLFCILIHSNSFNYIIYYVTLEQMNNRMPGLGRGLSW